MFNVSSTTSSGGSGIIARIQINYVGFSCVTVLLLFFDIVANTLIGFLKG